MQVEMLPIFEEGSNKKRVMMKQIALLNVEIETLQNRLRDKEFTDNKITDQPSPCHELTVTVPSHVALTRSTTSTTANSLVNSSVSAAEFIVNEFV